MFTAPDVPLAVPLSEIWDRSTRAAAWFHQELDPDEPVVVEMSSSGESLAILIGAWRAGLRAASVPPGKVSQIERHRLRLAETVALLGGASLIGPSAIPGLRMRPYSYIDRYGTTTPERWDSAEFIQFSSGTTGPPKGVRLSMEAIGANALQLHEQIDHADLVLSSWMPLSHDMGLMFVLASWAWFDSRAKTDGGGIHLVDPTSFLFSPTGWLRKVSTLRATLIGMSNHAMDLVAARLRRASDLRLDSVRGCVVGSEPIRASTLASFAKKLTPFGFSELALMPAYGLAEVTVAASMTRVDAPWRSVELPSLSESGTAEYVSLGPPLPGTQVRISPGHDHRIGTIEIRSPSVMTGYIGEILAPFTPDGWLRTRDIGSLVDGEVVVLGREDDVVFVGGVKLFATDIERIVAEVVRISPGRVAVLPDGAERFSIAIESRQADIDRLYATVREHLLRQVGFAPARMVVVPPGALPRTTSGKLRRFEAAGRLFSNGVPT